MAKQQQQLLLQLLLVLLWTSSVLSLPNFGVFSSRVAQRPRHYDPENAALYYDEDEDDDIQDDIHDGTNSAMMSDYNNDYMSDEDMDELSSSNSDYSPQRESPLLQIACQLVSLGGASISCPAAFCDTGAERTIMSFECAQACGLLQHLDRRYAGQAVGVGGACRVLGRIPAGVVKLRFSKLGSAMAPSITVIERVGLASSGSATSGPSQSIDLLLGLDFLRERQAVLDLQTEELQINMDDHRQVRIPFMQSGDHAVAAAAVPTALAAATTRSSVQNVEDEFDFSDDAEFDSEVEGIDMSGV
jgi:hypothetical protein